MSRNASQGEVVKRRERSPDPGVVQEDRGLFHVIEQLATLEAALWSILDGLKSNATHMSFFCREYWGTSASRAQLSLERLNFPERLKRQVQQTCVLESLSLGVASHLCSGVAHGLSVTIRSRLRNLLYYNHENCLALLDLVCQRWLAENPNRWAESKKSGHCPENLNLDLLVRVKRYRRLRQGEHIMALRQHNEMIANVLRQLCRGATSKRTPLSSRGSTSGDRVRSGVSPGAPAKQQATVLAQVNDILAARPPLDRLKASSIRAKMLQYMYFQPLLNIDGSDPDCPWPESDPFLRYGAEHFAQEGFALWYEPLPPMLPDLEYGVTLPAATNPENFTLVLDLDETLVHYFELDGMGNYGIRPGMHEFLQRMSSLGFEIVIFTAATQDYADWVIDQIDPCRLIHYRLYRQHALPWGPIFTKDLSRLGRELDRCLIIDNVQENFMLQPHNGIFIATWYDDPHDTALFNLTPLLDELMTSKVTVPEILEKYRDQIPTWAGVDQFSQFAGEYSEYDLSPKDGLASTPTAADRQSPQQASDYGDLDPHDHSQAATPQAHYPDAVIGAGTGLAATTTTYTGGYEQPPPGVYLPPWPRAGSGGYPQQPVLQQQQMHQAPPVQHQQMQQMQHLQHQPPQEISQRMPSGMQGGLHQPGGSPHRAQPQFSNISGPYQHVPPTQPARHHAGHAQSSIGRH